MVEPIALTENILDKKPSFIFTQHEWLRARGLQILKTASGTGTLYTTPPNKVFYLTSVYLSVIDHNGSTGATIRIVNAASIIKHHLLKFGEFPAANMTDSMTLSFPIPIRLDAGELIDCFLGGSAGACGISGFEVGKEIIFS
tara:strand:+ start:2702 stop:3127 length:426 start_codon:yes stop_codon:yes gene_type:complete